ncbi:hypothetical protein B0H17DRAFT_1132806 [Mycena rosella]|uniref:Glycan binding protein Y3-like domain-containing protein n=1 Tax=Mycena rosella TaxID=1033263 RepID=A0AAD7DK74_MYCRO|nr:hypothetical protein B0H17DRAFT_1132806 [Mycena rosella]
MFKNLVYLPTVALIAAVFAAMANAEGCYNGGNTNAAACSQFYDDFCDAASFGTRSACYVLNSGTHCDFSVSGSANAPAYSDCAAAYVWLAYWCDETGGLHTQNGYQYKLDPNDGGSC